MEGVEGPGLLKGCRSGVNTGPSPGTVSLGLGFT